VGRRYEIETGAALHRKGRRNATLESLNTPAWVPCHPPRAGALERLGKKRRKNDKKPGEQMKNGKFGKMVKLQ
jgi:hypothetical protein